MSCNKKKAVISAHYRAVMQSHTGFAVISDRHENAEDVTSNRASMF